MWNHWKLGFYLLKGIKSHVIVYKKDTFEIEKRYVGIKSHALHEEMIHL